MINNFEKDKMRNVTRDFDWLKRIDWKFLIENVVIETRKSIDSLTSIFDIAEEGITNIKKGLYKLFKRKHGEEKRIEYTWKAVRDK